METLHSLPKVTQLVSGRAEIPPTVLQRPYGHQGQNKGGQGKESQS